MNYSIELFKGKDDQFYWRVKAPNGEIILSSEGVKNQADRDAAVTNFTEALRGGKFTVRAV